MSDESTLRAMFKGVFGAVLVVILVTPFAWVLDDRRPAFAEEVPAEEIIRRVDEIRNPAEAYFMKVAVVNEGAPSDRSVFEVSVRGNSRTLVKTVEPPRDRGRNLLMVDEQMWAYIPNIKRAVRVSLSQKLTGQAANGDISRMRWSGDYASTVERRETSEWVLLLTAKKQGLTYEKVRVWVEKSTYRPLKAEFLTPAGKPLKVAVYSGYMSLAGKIRPSEIRIRDAVRENESSTVKILSMEERAFPESIFNQNSLK